jgi:hypothetical protein
MILPLKSQQSASYGSLSLILCADKLHILVTKNQLLLFTLTQKVTKSSSHCSLELGTLLSYRTIACGTRFAQTVLGPIDCESDEQLPPGSSKVTTNRRLQRAKLFGSGHLQARFIICTFGVWGIHRIINNRGRLIKNNAWQRNRFIHNYLVYETVEAKRRFCYAFICRSIVLRFEDAPRVLVL